MRLERFLSVIPSLSSPRLPLPVPSDGPPWVEWLLFAAFLSILALLYGVFTKLFPIVRSGRSARVGSRPCTRSTAVS